jgi:exosome complex RNA-binding protein Csl4
MQPAKPSLVLRAERKVVMATSANDIGATYFAAGRGYHAVYRDDGVNHCPGCGRTQWIIGRVSAECAFCATALPLAEASMRSHTGPVVIQHKNRQANAWAA